MRKKHVLIGVLIATAAGIGAFVNLDNGANREPVTVGEEANLTPPATAPSPTQSSKSSTGTETWSEDDDERPDNLVSAQWDQASIDSALAAATVALAAFDSDDDQTDRWLENLMPLLTPNAQTIYPLWSRSLIPSLELTGQPTVVQHQSPLIATVEFPTADEPYCVLLIRDDGASPWLVEAFVWASELP